MRLKYPFLLFGTLGLLADELSIFVISDVVISGGSEERRTLMSIIKHDFFLEAFLNDVAVVVSNLNFLGYKDVN